MRKKFSVTNAQPPNHLPKRRPDTHTTVGIGGTLHTQSLSQDTKGLGVPDPKDLKNGLLGGHLLQISLWI
jgi:hypothetical protein